MKVAAVIVTYNRKQFIVDTIRSVLGQTRPPDRIFLIDNASTDGTAELIGSSGILSEDIISYIRLDRNTGGAGGFATGIAAARDAGFDWFWTMDDDVEPKDDALETLLGYTNISECINATKIFTQNNEIQYWEQYYDFATSRLIDLKNASFNNGKKWCPVNVACFEGMLVSKRVVDIVGLPDASFFIYQDDTLFGILASLHTNVIYVRDAILYKKIYGYGAVTPMRAYYSIRNNFKLKRKAFSTGLLGQPSRITNFLFLMNNLLLSKQFLASVPTFKVLKSILKGWRDGYRGV